MPSIRAFLASEPYIILTDLNLGGKVYNFFFSSYLYVFPSQVTVEKQAYLRVGYLRSPPSFY